MDLVDLALAEDLGPQGVAGDITSRAFIPESSISCAKIVSRSACVASGLAVAQEVFRRVDPSLKISVACAEGDSLSPGALLLEVTGPTRSILSGERTALNFMQRLTGIATLTRRFVDGVKGSGAAILDTRKTTPGMRTLEKYAVLCGGGVNHPTGASVGRRRKHDERGNQMLFGLNSEFSFKVKNLILHLNFFKIFCPFNTF